MPFGRCCICTLPFSLKDVASLKCGHTYHHGCIKRWIETSKTCPNCRKKSLLQDITRLFFDEETSASESFFQPEAEDIDTVKAELCDQKQMVEDFRRESKKHLDDFKKEQERVKKWKHEVEKQTAKINELKNQLYFFEHQLDINSDVEKRLREVEAKYKASSFYELLMKKSGGDEEEVKKYITDKGDIETARFISLQKKNFEHLKIKLEELRTELHQVKTQKSELEKRLLVAAKKYEELKKKCKDKSFEKAAIQNHSFGTSYEPIGSKAFSSSTDSLIDSSPKPKRQNYSKISTKENKQPFNFGAQSISNTFNNEKPSSSLTYTRTEWGNLDSFDRHLLSSKNSGIGKCPSFNNKNFIEIDDDSYPSPLIPKGLADTKKNESTNVKRKITINKTAEGHIKNQKMLSTMYKVQDAFK